MPQMPASSVGTARMPAQEASFFMMSFGAQAQLVRRRLTARADRRVGRRVAVADRDDVARADEDVRLAALDPPLLLVPVRRAQDQEEAVAVLVQLGTLMRLVRVLDREIVQAELALHRAQLV